MIWSLIKFDDSHHHLLTGDRPMVMTNGINRPNSYIVMPVSPRVLFVAANEQRVIDRIRDMAESAGLVQRLNNQLARQARRYVYAVDDTVVRFVAPRLGEKARWSPWE
jgi:hypothetical protein